MTEQLALLMGRDKPHSCPAQEIHYAVNVRTMRDAQKPIAAWMRDVMKRKGWTAGGWSVAAKVGKNTVARSIREDYPFVTSTSTLVKLAQVAQEPLPTGFAFGDAPGVPSADVLSQVLQEVLEVLAPGTLPDSEGLALVAEAFRDTLAALVDDPPAATDPSQARIYARALSRRYAH